jgi:hypothetical protein
VCMCEWWLCWVTYCMCTVDVFVCGNGAGPQGYFYRKREDRPLCFVQSGSLGLTPSHPHTHIRPYYTPYSLPSVIHIILISYNLNLLKRPSNRHLIPLTHPLIPYTLLSFLNRLLIPRPLHTLPIPCTFLSSLTQLLIPKPSSHPSHLSLIQHSLSSSLIPSSHPYYVHSHVPPSIIPHNTLSFLTPFSKLSHPPIVPHNLLPSLAHSLILHTFDSSFNLSLIPNPSTYSSHPPLTPHTFPSFLAH